MTDIFNQRDQLERRRTLRAQCPPAERVLWQGLRGKRLGGYRFRRQYGVGPYVLDFYCPRAKLAIEVDGPTHNDEAVVRKDAERQQFIEGLGITFFRCGNDNVYNNLEGVLTGILALLLAVDDTAANSAVEEDTTPPQPSPS